jgi:DNA-binding transcriptional ArsR family regulator
MTLPHPLSGELAEQIAQRFRVLGEPMRIRILDLLRDGETSVQELTDRLGTTQQNVSKHLGILHGAGIVSRRRDGNRVLYAIADESVFELCDAVCGGLRRRLAELDELLAGAPR